MSTSSALPFGGDLTQPTAPEYAADPDDAAAELRPYRVAFDETIFSQKAFLGTDNRYYNFTSGVGAGKTVSGILRVAANVEEWNEGEMGMIVTPTTLGLKNVILPELSKWGFLSEWEYKGPQSEEPGLHAPNGSRVLLESADNDRKIERLRGPSISWVWIDEAALVPEKAWDILMGRLRTGSYRNAFITTTPKGYNWVYDKFVNEDTRLDDVQNVLGVPSFANPHLPLDYRREILDEYDGRFHDQEVLGEFTAFEGLVHPWFDEENVLPIDELPETYDHVVYGVDWGHSNPAVVLAIVRQGDRWVVVDEWYERRCTPDDHARAVEAMVDEWGPGPVYCDPSEPANIETFKRNSIAAKAAENDVTPGIQHVSKHADTLRVAESCQNLRNEFNQYQYRDGGDSDRPLKQHDHAMDALRYALFTHESQPKRRTKHQRGGNNEGTRVYRHP